MKTKNEDIKREIQTSPAPKFTIEKLRENSLKLFGVTQSTLDGVTYGLSGEFTVSEIKKIISNWQNKEVK